MTLEEIKVLAKRVYDETKSVPTVGHILRDDYGIFNIKQTYGISLEQIIKPPVPDAILCLLKKYLRYQKHILAHKRDKHNKRFNPQFKAQITNCIKYCSKTYGTQFIPQLDTLESQLNKIWKK